MPASVLAAALQNDLAKALAACPQSVAMTDALDLLQGLTGAPQTGLATEDAIWPKLFAPSPSRELVTALTAARVAMAEPRPAAMALSERLPVLRAELQRRNQHGFVIPHGDEHQSEFIPAASERLAWLTGFTGSAGIAIVLAQKAAVFIDGRYTLQVRDQVDTDAFETLHVIEQPPADWLAANLPADTTLALDPWLHSADAVERFQEAVTKAGARLELVEANPVDAIWEDRPARPLAPVIPHPIEFAGEATEAKRQRLAETMSGNGQNAAVLCQPDSVAWLLNIRGGDTAHTPLPLSFAILHDDGRADLFCDARKLLAETKQHLGNGVQIAPLSALGDTLDRLGAAEAKVLADRQSTPAWVLNRLAAAGAVVANGADPCVAPRAAKNAVEVAGARAAHKRDAVAITRFLAWIDQHGPSGTVGEVRAAEQLLAFRQEVEGFRDQSFPTISGYGPNGAIVHYRATAETERKLEPGSFYLVDSGGQFPEGTTDITRTVSIGEATEDMRRAFTRVLQGHIGLATARFPVGTNGTQLDTLARAPLWSDGLDFDHGTGHGVGSYLGVHEGPQRVAKTGAVAFVPGMIVSNEPGYYKAGAFGIRTENLLVVRESAEMGDAGRKFLEFETITLAPFDRRAIDVSLLTLAERDWLNAYHARVRAEVGPGLDAETRSWMEHATAAV